MVTSVLPTAMTIKCSWLRLGMNAEFYHKYIVYFCEALDPGRNFRTGSCHHWLDTWILGSQVKTLRLSAFTTVSGVLYVCFTNLLKAC